jgi:hypothetical protein
LDVNIGFAGNHTFSLLRKFRTANMRIEISRRIFPVKRKSILAIFAVLAVSFLTSCGASDKVASITLTTSGTTGTVNLAGLGGTLQLQVTANYTSGKIVDETNWSTYAATAQGVDDTGATLPAPPQGISINATGMVTATEPGICTWTDLTASSSSSSSTPAWAIVGWYQVIATYKGMQSQPLYIPVASAASAQSGTNGECGPSSSNGG